MTYSRILVAIDFGDEADEILAAATRMMDVESSDLYVVTVVKPLTGFYVDLYATLADAGEIESRTIASTAAWHSELIGRHGVNVVDSKVLIGTPANEIRSLALEMSADLIVLGTHGQHGLGLLLGSTANAVLHGAPCDVLCVRVFQDKQAG